ncbi:hypothetical protein QTJ16_001829 [Diplocarpon rosae]|uniref:Uncharacterized protein n=1 Tax=Diplocarpon rosae TaxID=946125 RepID=A0AAD9WGS7_9HELO|nr:hypothetical protein QTJ16_001829 [Diplocarpon rosae]
MVVGLHVKTHPLEHIDASQRVLSSEHSELGLRLVILSFLTDLFSFLAVEGQD